MLTLCCLAVLAPPRPTARQVTSVLPFTGVWPTLVSHPGGPELGRVTGPEMCNTGVRGVEVTVETVIAPRPTLEALTCPALEALISPTVEVLTCPALEDLTCLFRSLICPWRRLSGRARPGKQLVWRVC